MFRKLILVGLAAFGIGMATAGTADAQFYSTPYSGYNPYTNRFYNGTYTYSPFGGGVVQSERMFNPLTGVTTYGQQSFNPYTGYNNRSFYQYNPYSNQYRYRFNNGFAYPGAYYP